MIFLQNIKKLNIDQDFCTALYIEVLTAPAVFWGYKKGQCKINKDFIFFNYESFKATAIESVLEWTEYVPLNCLNHQLDFKDKKTWITVMVS